MKVVDEGLLVLTVLCPEVLLLHALLLRFHKLFYDLIDFLLDAAKTNHWLDQAAAHTVCSTVKVQDQGWLKAAQIVFKVLKLHEILSQTTLSLCGCQLVGSL